MSFGRCCEFSCLANKRVGVSGCAGQRTARRVDYLPHEVPRSNLNRLPFAYRNASRKQLQEGDWNDVEGTEPVSLRHYSTVSAGTMSDTAQKYFSQVLIHFDPARASCVMAFTAGRLRQVSNPEPVVSLMPALKCGPQRYPIYACSPKPDTMSLT